MNSDKINGRFAFSRCFKGFGICALIILGIFFFMLLLSALTPMVCDDFAYCFSFDTWERIESVWDIFPSMKMHRVYANGRIIAHFLVQLLLLLPKMVFNVLNAFNAALLFFLLLRFVGFEAPKKSLFLLMCAVMLIWYFTPDFGQVFLWLDGACNYSWAVVITLLFLSPYFRAYYYNSRDCFAAPCAAAKKLGFIPLALIAGGYSESASCAMLFMAFVFIVLMTIKRKKIPSLLIIGFALAALSFLYMMSSPVEAGDKAVFSPGHVLYNFSYIVSCFKSYQAGLFCAFAALLALSLVCGADKNKILVSLVFFVGGFVSAAVFSFSSYFPARALCPISVYTVLAMLFLISALWDKGEIKLLSCAASVMAVLFAMELVLGVYDIGLIYGQSLEREALVAEAKAAGADHVRLEPYTPTTKYSGVSGLEDVHWSEANWVNVNMAKYYEFGWVLGPEAK